jgi:3-methyladenine DNA glycosylase/8-oxoguanine DNA glycosylase
MALELAPELAFSLRPTAPFNFDATFHKPSHFPAASEHFEPGRYWQSMIFGGQALGLRLENAGHADDPLINVAVHSAAPVRKDLASALAAELRRRFDLDADLARFERQCGADPLLAPALDRWRGMRVGAGGSLYEMLVIYVLLQNATVRRTVQMMQALFERFGTLLRFDSRELYAFWPPETLAAVPEDELRALKLGYRARTLKRLSDALAAGEVDETRLRGLSKDEARGEVLKLYGIGPASVWYLLFEVFHHYDALDYVSPWEQRIYSRLFFDEELAPAERIIDEAKRRWGRWRMLAAHYLFEDLFWRRKNEPVGWLEGLIRL